MSSSHIVLLTSQAHPTQNPNQILPKLKPILQPQPVTPSTYSNDQVLLQMKSNPRITALVSLAQVSLHGSQIADGLWFDKDRRTRDGGVVRVLTVDPAKLDIRPVFHANSRYISPREIRREPSILAAINASFFGARSLIGDIKAGDKVFVDDNNAWLDNITDQRYFLGSNPEGRLLTGKGGLVENPSPQFQSFIGGFPALYTRGQAQHLEADIHNGKFAERANYGGAAQSSTISRSFMGITADGKLILVAAGEGNRRSKGVSMVGGARLLKNLGAVEAYILDGGGSTSMFVRNKEFAHTDGRRVKSYLAIHKK